jgi:phospholipid-transporting ATPase
VNDPVNRNQKQAIIVAGASLVMIDADPFMKQVFLDASDKVDVVLACRVSPKQKADIVNMIRARFPNKGTLSIGDGANDVNMILQAHVGVGILGKEGQQAARSADFAIGKFKFLKPLMFVHGREAYRRNSMLILYNFYKNVMYVTAQYFFGFFSAFSGQPLYEPMIYQLYNITMTSVPIMFYSLFDFEYEKDSENSYASSRKHYFMKHPHLYKIGLNSECFGIGHYLKWVLYGLFHAFLIYLFNF